MLEGRLDWVDAEMPVVEERAEEKNEVPSLWTRAKGFLFPLWTRLFSWGNGGFQDETVSNIQGGRYLLLLSRR